jgi:CRP-like cAMP-binding protein
MAETTKLPTAKKPSFRPDYFSCAAKDRTEWCALSQGELEIINNTKIAREYMPGEVLFHQGDARTGLYCFEHGMVGV